MIQLDINNLKPGIPFKLFGPAGSGKTTMANKLAEGYKTTFLSYTGKAATRMRECGCTTASTIHRALYKATRLPGGEYHFEYAPSEALRTAELIIIDECSMCPRYLANDLLKANKSARFLVLGDPCQLPPIEPENAPFYGTADLLLTEVFRQELDSPILEYANQIRESMGKVTWLPEGIREVSDFREVGVDIFLCGRNTTRNSINAYFHALNPENDHPLIVTENSYDFGVFNGEIYPLSYYLEKGIPTTMTDKYARKPVKVDFGYAITVHKAQGSQWNNVGLFAVEAELFKEFSWRWLYTGITRAAKELVVIL